MGTLGRRSALVLLATLAPVLLQAQQTPSRYRILIPDFHALERVDRGFGEKAAEALRERMNALVTHQVVERGELRSELRRIDLEMQDLECVETRQVGLRMGVQVVL